ncbi:MAG: UDP-N-acetylglucosamine 2-epimerase (non-hydrolyzing) [Candidatus Magasanikbacteria bacterium CG10_big_fil_rev_8_21_14_0_10_47_10]|uniref:UDP-N-acetylglucosamine 2-epimerase (Non-hydrolyzing) n=1 Tax=Candidatus Magasanikbacteria bacterium CG10_big_fil_rev_8_21_14_0_10_47_10 TaxID=1974652 RepID=A0A2H0TPV2_9BACT|nr:MAG: UDP-N-acetylglucosamine 2-epimerase (non-hydrolyzing) [Candidatus Magasanikbacteria bacterium CG10_big_fil_rev_8_21_14_0_10_47_10]
MPYTVAIIVGTRPEIIKMSPVIRACESNGVAFVLIHTGQHYDHTMDGAFFDDLGLSPPAHNVRVGSRDYASQMGYMMRALETVLKQACPDIVLVQGDTNTVLAGALAANKLQIPIGHVEAGLRSGDMNMIEERNRILTDHLAEYLFAPTGIAKTNLLDEGIAAEKVYVTGNTVSDAVYQNLAISESRENVCSMLGLEKKKYVLVTAHRAENVDQKNVLNNILLGLSRISEELQMPLVLPVHPRTKHNIQSFGLDVPDAVRTIEPMGYLDFLQLQAHAALIVTDSGGLQEEASILHVPCVTIRVRTERPETVEAGMNCLSDVSPEAMASAAKTMYTKDIQWRDLYGKGRVAEQILAIIRERNTYEK